MLKEATSEIQLAKYAEAIFENLGADAITVAPYMGADSVTPFTDRKTNGPSF